MSQQQLTSSLSHLECSSCGERHEIGKRQGVCTACGRPLLARYDLQAAAKTLDLQNMAGRSPDMWRYLEVMPSLAGGEIVTLGEGLTPLLLVPRLGAELGLRNLYIKDEGRNPTGTFKARGLAAAVTMAKQVGVREIALPTAGNAGAAAAAYAARAGMASRVAMPRDAPAAVMGEVRAFGGQLELVDGLINDAGKLIARGCQENGWHNVATFKEPYRAEGKKSMGYELWEQMDGELPDVILYPTGGGTGLVGMWKAFAELEEMGKIGPARPRMVAVQSVGCAPVVKAFSTGQSRSEPWLDAHTLAPGIRVPTPFADDLILDALTASGGEAVAVSDDDIVAAVATIAAIEGVDACPEGAATFVGLRHLVECGWVAADEKVVLFNCGTGLKHPELRPS